MSPNVGDHPWAVYVAKRASYVAKRRAPLGTPLGPSIPGPPPSLATLPWLKPHCASTDWICHPNTDWELSKLNCRKQHVSNESKQQVGMTKVEFVLAAPSAHNESSQMQSRQSQTFHKGMK